MKRFLYVTLLCLLGMETGYAATAAKGVFSVSGTKIVQFANANSVYSENELIQWSHVSDVIESGWDVLTGEEWSYLLVTRDGEGTSKNNLGTVNGKKGLIILPDEWSQPAGTAYAATPQEYETNQYTTAEWTKMANAGAVFLPCGGYSDEASGGTPTIDSGDHGAYWGKDAYNSTNAYCMRFQEEIKGGIHDLNNAVKTNYYSVILVRDVTVTVLDEDHEASAYVTDFDAAKGKYFAKVNRTLVKDGTLYTLCLPFDVPDIDDSPLAGADVYTFEGGSVAGTTGNEILHLNLSRLTGKRLTQGVPYLLKWENTGETLTKPLYFENVENWDTDTETATDPGNETVKFHGVYPKAHIPGYTSESVVAHYNFFLGANNTLYWPDDTGDDGAWATHKMKGFRAYFYITPGGGPSSAPAPRNMPVVWHINSALGATTDIDNGEWLKVNGECTKVIRNGQIYLMYKGTMYDVQGRRIEN